MSDDLRAAAETVRRVRACDLHPSSPDARGARATLADAYLAEHPADDGEPVTEGWLAALGWTSDGYSYPFWSLSVACSVQMGVFMAAGGESRLEVNRHTVAQPATRGHVRRLVRAMGVPLTEGG